jgi:hypothetical protein
MRLADLIEADRAVAAFNIGSVCPEMGRADIFDAVRLGTAMPAFDGRVSGQAPDEVVPSLSLEFTHVHLVIFIVAVHIFSLFIL